MMTVCIYCLENMNIAVHRLVALYMNIAPIIMVKCMYEVSNTLGCIPALLHKYQCLIGTLSCTTFEIKLPL